MFFKDILYILFHCIKDSIIHIIYIYAFLYHKNSFYHNFCIIYFFNQNIVDDSTQYIVLCNFKNKVICRYIVLTLFYKLYPMNMNYIFNVFSPKNNLKDTLYMWNL